MSKRKIYVVMANKAGSSKWWKVCKFRTAKEAVSWIYANSLEGYTYTVEEFSRC